MNTWRRIVMVSVLAFLLLEPIMLVTGIAQENFPLLINVSNETYRHADDSLGDIGIINPGLVLRGNVSADTDSTKVVLASSGPAIIGVPIFPTDDIWNTPVDSLPVDHRSADYVATIGSDAYLHADFGSGMYDGTPIGIPFNIVNGSQQKKSVTFEYSDESDPGPYPIPDNPLIEGGSDHHMLIIDRDAMILYELFAVERNADGSWVAGSGAVFNLSDYTLRPSGWTSADAAGLAILPGLARFDEVNTGEITHALRFTVPSTRQAYVWPARHFASSVTDPSYPSMGQRFRLKSSFNTSGYPFQARIVLESLKKYGMILSDNGAPWYITGAPDDRWNNDDLHTLHQLKGSNFEAVDSSSLIINQDSGQALIHQVNTGTSDRTGLFRNGTWNLDYNSDGVSDKTFHFGTTGDIPVIGDWDGNGISDVGVFRPSNGNWYFDTTRTGIVNNTFHFGTTGDIPVIGDWDGNGISDIGVFRPSNGNWYFDTTRTGAVNNTFHFGTIGDTPKTGTWN